MSVQKSIVSFFKPGVLVASKRNLLKDNVNASNKRFKTSSNDSQEKDISFSEINDAPKQNDDLISEKSDVCSNENNLSGSNILTGVLHPPVSAADRKEIEKKRLQAKLKVVSKKFSVVDPDIGVTWVAAFENEFSKPYFEKLNDFVEKERRNKTIFPPPDQVWTWTKLCSLDKVKVVIIGQDPYHNPRQAHGLSFSVPVGVTLPPSLQNIYKELEKNFPDFVTPSHGYLIGWAMQGVLLLNAVLTVEAHKPNSHKDQGWEQLTSAVIKYLNDKTSGIVFLLWGAYAQKKADFVDTKKHLVLKSPHPSPFSANKGFFGCNHFSKCNEYLVKKDLEPINWDWLPKEHIPGGPTGKAPLKDFSVPFKPNN